MVKVPINNTKHITIAKIYIYPRDSASTHSSCNNNFDKQLMYFHNNFLVHITIWKCKNECGVLLILFNVTECAQDVLITDTTPFVLVNRRKSLGLEFSLTFLYRDTRMFLPFNCQYNPNIGFLIICLKFCQ